MSIANIPTSAAVPGSAPGPEQAVPGSSLLAQAAQLRHFAWNGLPFDVVAALSASNPTPPHRGHASRPPPLRWICNRNIVHLFMIKNAKVLQYLIVVVSTIDLAVWLTSMTPPAAL